MRHVNTVHTAIVHPDSIKVIKRYLQGSKKVPLILIYSQTSTVIINCYHGQEVLEETNIIG